MAIAKVEPLTTARALRGPFDYRLPPAMADLEGPQRDLYESIRLAGTVATGSSYFLGCCSAFAATTPPSAPSPRRSDSGRRSVGLT